MRAQRRLSGFVVVALLILGAIAAGHHHRLAASSDAPALSAPASFDPMGRTDCVACRAADPARIVIAEVAAPRILIVPFAVLSSTTNVLPAFFRPCSPRAPPTAA